MSAATWYFLGVVYCSVGFFAGWVLYVRPFHRVIGPILALASLFCQAAGVLFLIFAVEATWS